MSQRNMTRRTFITFTAAAALSGCATTKRARKTVSPNEKLNIAGIGVGGQGGGDIRSCASENIVALCDVDWDRAQGSFAAFPNAAKFKDFREMLDKQRDIDAVVISTPDHTHAVAAMAAMELGLHVRVQKPLTWSIEEARMLTKTAANNNIITAMGNQGHSGDGVREMCEILWSNVVGPVREVHIWTDRPIWPQGIKDPLPAEAIPETLDWDLWQGPAQVRPYNAGYLPFKWRGWWDYGCGALGDMACHIMDPAYWSLLLGAPTSVECIHEEGCTEQCAPLKSIIKYEFPERVFKEPYPTMGWYNKLLPPVTLYWYDGGLMPPRPEGVAPDEKLGDGDNGSLFIADGGCVTTGCYGGETRLVPGGRMAGFMKPAPVIPRVPDENSFMEWINGIKTNTQPSSNFSYAGPFTEVVLLGNIAVRVGKGVKLEWDGAKGIFSNSMKANALLERDKYRHGFQL